MSEPMTPTTLAADAPQLSNVKRRLQFMVDSIAREAAEVAATYPDLYATLQRRRAAMGNLGAVQVFGEIAMDTLADLRALDTPTPAQPEKGGDAFAQDRNPNRPSPAICPGVTAGATPATAAVEALVKPGRDLVSSLCDDPDVMAKSHLVDLINDLAAAIRAGGA